MHRLMLCCNELTRYALQRTRSISLDGRTSCCLKINLAIEVRFSFFWYQFYRFDIIDDFQSLHPSGL
jgi:hypothetical protein